MIPFIIMANLTLNTIVEMFLVILFCIPTMISLFFRDNLLRNNYCMASLVQSQRLFHKALDKITEGLLQSGANNSTNSPKIRVVASKRTRAQQSVLGNLDHLDLGDSLGGTDRRITRRMSVRSSSVSQVTTFNVKRMARSCFCLLFRPTYRDSALLNQQIAELTTAASKLGIRTILNSDGSLFLLSRACSSPVEGAEYPIQMVKLIQRKVPSEFPVNLMQKAVEHENNLETMKKSPFDHDYVFTEKISLDDEGDEEDVLRVHTPTWSISFGEVIQQCAISLVERNPIMFNIHGGAVQEVLQLEDKLRWTPEAKRTNERGRRGIDTNHR
eukprot:TRINITY_DN7774_c0_g3_i1.p1 TRINITY_DN7774_c0_g3~~TRINITY_DN7774_c0_g3_i1.p1  ORF type:complete len:328 (-),score=93.44 TRINITY_DN7774_c0_g3_i1:548-1531(-)